MVLGLDAKMQKVFGYTAIARILLKRS